MRRVLFTTVISMFLWASLSSASWGCNLKSPVHGALAISSPNVAGEIASNYSGLLQQGRGSAAEHNAGQPKTSTGLCVADILGIFFFVEFLITHFCLCRKGVYPESFSLCSPQMKSKRGVIKGKEKAP